MLPHQFFFLHEAETFQLFFSHSGILAGPFSPVVMSFPNTTLPENILDNNTGWKERQTSFSVNKPLKKYHKTALISGGNLAHYMHWTLLRDVQYLMYLEHSLGASNYLNFTKMKCQW